MAATAPAGAGETPAKSSSPAADVGSLSAMLAAKWKSGPAAPAASGGTPAAVDPHGLRQGQVRQFRILALVPDKKQIELEIV